MTPCKGMTPAVTAAAIAPMIIVSIFFSPSFNDIIYHDILSRSLLIYLLWQNHKMKTTILQGSSPNQPIIGIDAFPNQPIRKWKTVYKNVPIL